MKTVTVRLPWPPSVNHYYGRSKNGRVFLKEPGRLFRRKAATEFARMGWPRLEGKVRVALILSPPDNRKRDIDNIRKAAYDALSDRKGHTGIIADDADIIADRAEFVSEREGWIEAVISSANGDTDGR